MAAKFVMEAVAAAVIQDGVSRGVSSVLGKRKEKASQGEFLDRLETAVYNISLAFERADKLQPVTEVSLLWRWAKLKREYMEATNLLGKLQKKRQEQPQQKTGQTLVTHTSSSSSSPGHHGRRSSWVRPDLWLSFVSSFVGRLRASKDNESLCLSRETVERFERLADSAKDFLESVQSGCSLRRQMIFSGPLVSHLLEGKILLYKMAEGSRQQRHLVLCPVRLQERGQEALLHYVYTDGESREKSFELYMMLRLTESTDTIQVARKCLESLESQCKLVLAPLIGELTLLAGSPDITAHHSTSWASIQEEHTRRTQLYRPDPVCCSALHEPCANDMASSEFSKMFPQEVILFGFKCSVPSIRPDHRLLAPGRSSSDEAGTSFVMRDPPPLLQLHTLFMPHFMPPLQPVLVEGLQEEGIAFSELDGGKCELFRDTTSSTKCSIQQAAEQPIVGLFHLQAFTTLIKSFDEILGDSGPRLGGELPTCNRVKWFSKHGAAFFRGDIL